MYNYQYRKPRFSNPTFSSYNVDTTMRYFVSPFDSYRTSNNRTIDEGGRKQQLKPFEKQPRKTESNLSNIGTKSLEISEKEVYKKQDKKFNIISLKPKEHQETIKQYPKFSLEDKDENYFKKMEQKPAREQKNNLASYRDNFKQKNIAGRHTFAIEEGKHPNYYQHGRFFKGKMLNHADEVGSLI